MSLQLVHLQLFFPPFPFSWCLYLIYEINLDLSYLSNFRDHKFFLPSFIWWTFWIINPDITCYPLWKFFHLYIGHCLAWSLLKVMKVTWKVVNWKKGEIKQYTVTGQLTYAIRPYYLALHIVFPLVVWFWLTSLCFLDINLMLEYLWCCAR